MPRRRSLHQRLQSKDWLRSSWSELKKRPRSHGLSPETIEDFGKNLDERLREIRSKLRKGTYQFGQLRAIAKTELKPSGKIKRRVILSSDIPDRVVQKGIARLVESLLTGPYNLTNEASFAYIRKRGTGDRRGVRDALARMVMLYRQGRPIAFEADLKDFFGSVNKDQLLQQMVYPRLPDDSINSLIYDAVSQEIGNRHEIPPEFGLTADEVPGIPQGGGLSPLFANVYLSSFDRDMLAAGFGLVRYADDFIVMCRDDAEASAAWKLSRQILESRLGLHMHPLSDGSDAKTRIVTVTRAEFQFLGIRFDGSRLWPSRDKLNRLLAKVDEITAEWNGQNLLKVLGKMKHLVEGWVSAYGFTDLAPLIERIESRIDKKVGACAHRMKWAGRPHGLSKRQRRFSGIPPVAVCWQHSKEALSATQRTLFFQRSSTGKSSRSAPISEQPVAVMVQT